MNRKKGIMFFMLVLLVTSSVFPNGGPFVIKYPKSAAARSLSQIADNLLKTVENDTSKSALLAAEAF